MDGVVLVDKGEGEGSRSCAAAVARRLGARKFGHAGTLDPFASGLLIVLMGRACRTQDWFTRLPKEYEATARLGAVSSTGDPEGTITETGNVPAEPLELPTGRVRQRPPVHSAVHVGGRRAYERARKGEQFETPEREVEVYEFVETGRDGDSVDFLIRCGSGTYVRSLIADLGDAYTTRLRRTAVGPFTVEEADPGRIIPIAEALVFLPTVTLGPQDARRAGHGVALSSSGPPAEARWQHPAVDPEEVLLVDHGEAVAIAAEAEGGLLKPIVGFRG